MYSRVNKQNISVKDVLIWQDPVEAEASAAADAAQAVEADFQAVPSEALSAEEITVEVSQAVSAALITDITIITDLFSAPGIIVLFMFTAAEAQATVC